MRIIIQQTMIHVDIDIHEDADAYDAANAVVAAMIMDGYGAEIAYKALNRRLKEMEGLGDEV